MARVEIIGVACSNDAWTCRIAPAGKGVPYALVNARPHSELPRAIDPRGKAPVLRHGAVTLRESRAICLGIDPPSKACPAAAMPMAGCAACGCGPTC